MKFNEKLVMNSYILSLLGMESFEQLAKEFNDSIIFAEDENGNSYFYNRLVNNITSLNKKISNDKLAEYDENIIRYTNSMGRDIKWKYFQYLSLLFVEIYLDQYFNEQEDLLNNLNAELEVINNNILTFNEAQKVAKDKVAILTPYGVNDLNKIALYNATGSGKTLLMHINLMQFKHYSLGKIKMNKTVLITPNEGLSNQHLTEFRESNITAEIFTRESKGLFESSAIEIIEITKLGDDHGDKTVAVDSFEDNNLVFIDEGHRGSSGDKWKVNRDKLSAKGFSFEYSATFSQAINSNSGVKKKELEDEYCKAIIFDYSYKYFYNDGYGKDYSILNLDDDTEVIRNIYLIASLLSFYQQLKIYSNNKSKLKQYLIEKPLMVFVGSSVNAVRSENKKNVSDVVDIMLFIDFFIKNKQESVSAIDRILSKDSGLQNGSGEDLFTNKFSFIESLNNNANDIYTDMLAIIFNTSSGILHIENLKSADGEIGLRVGENDYFGVINVGDSDKLTKMCDENGIRVESRDFSHSLFNSINEKASTINLLIGSKKFSEGWSSWRVSTMGLMNVGKSEGPTIIQLFGRGVRLKGYDFCLKRSRALPSRILERKFQPIETLNIFGLKADYMTAFKKFLLSEGVPVDEKVEFVLPVIYDEKYKKSKLRVLKLEKGKNYKNEVNLDLEFTENSSITKKVLLNLYKKVESLDSVGRRGNKLSQNEEEIRKELLSFIDRDRVYFSLLQFKNEKRWSNLNINKDIIDQFINNTKWYTLVLPADDLKVINFKSLSKIENIFISLFKKYVKSFYDYKRSEWESQFLEYRELDDQEDKANFIENYSVSIDDCEIDLIERFKQVENILNSPNADIAQLNNLRKTEDVSILSIGAHLYNPLIYKDKSLTTMQIKPVHLNEGEKKFVEDLSLWIQSQASALLDTELYLLRNQSKTGLGFFTEGNFYPDFILWIIKDDKQYISFIDPKGIRNLNPKNDPKLNFSIKIKEIETKLGDDKTILNSFIISNTSLSLLNDLHSNLTYDFFEQKNVLFQEQKNYVEYMVRRVLN